MVDMSVRFEFGLGTVWSVLSNTIIYVFLFFKPFLFFFFEKLHWQKQGNPSAFLLIHDLSPTNHLMPRANDRTVFPQSFGIDLISPGLRCMLWNHFSFQRSATHHRHFGSVIMAESIQTTALLNQQIEYVRSTRLAS